MLELHKLLWVVPGVIFIHIYNKRRPIDSINLSGWSYLFSLVIIAAFTWLPVEILFQDKLGIFGRGGALVLPVVSGLLSGFIALTLTSSAITKWPSRSYVFAFLAIAVIIWLFVEIIFFNELSFFDKQRVMRIWMPVVFWPVLFILPLLLVKFSNIISFNTQDSFLADCIRWENSPVILSLRNDKVYIGILLKYPENPRAGSESQTISIIPLISGGRSKNTKEVKWGVFYPQDDLQDCEISIPRNEIITFGKFNERIFEHFYKNKSAS